MARARELDAEAVKAEVFGPRFLALAEELGGSFKGARRGTGDVRIPCFLHGGSGPNLVLTPARGLWHCMSTCGGGDAIGLVEKARGLAFPEALAWLAEWAGFRVTSDAWTPPMTREERPLRPVAVPVPDPPRADAGPFLAELWSIVAEAPLGPAVDRYLRTGRGIEPDTAYALGCRDWTTRLEEIQELVQRAPLEVLEAAGLVKDGRRWGPLAGLLRGDPSWAGLAVPSWRLGAAYPERWRWRLFVPRTPPGAVKPLKSWASFGGGDTLLGAGRPGRLDAPEVELAWIGGGGPGSELVLLAEGEPDWWAATEAVDGRAVVLGVCGAPGRWSDTWPSFAELRARGVRRVAVCVHHGAPKRDDRGHGESFAEAVAVACAVAGLDVRRKLPAEGRDMNDLHRAGALRAWLAELLEEMTWATT